MNIIHSFKKDLYKGVAPFIDVDAHAKQVQKAINGTFKRHVVTLHQEFTFSMEHMYHNIDPNYSKHMIDKLFYSMSQKILSLGAYEAERLEDKHWIKQRYSLALITEPKKEF